jgi:predicted nucleic acid-binding protein
LASLIDTSLLAEGAIPAGLRDEWSVSVVSIGELEAGILRARDEGVRARRLARLAAVLSEVPVIPIDRTVAARYGELRAAAGRKPTNDLWIAATALAHDFTLVTADKQQASLPLVRAELSTT